MTAHPPELPPLPPLTCGPETGHVAIHTPDQIRAYARIAQAEAVAHYRAMLESLAGCVTRAAPDCGEYGQGKGVCGNAQCGRLAALAAQPSAAPESEIAMDPRKAHAEAAKEGYLYAYEDFCAGYTTACVQMSDDATPPAKPSEQPAHCGYCGGTDHRAADCLDPHCPSEERGQRLAAEQPATGALTEALHMALACIRWNQFGECRTVGWSGPPPTPADTDAAILAALANRQAGTGGEDTRRLDWLEKMAVNVRTNLRYGSHNLFWSSPEDLDGDTGPSDIRARIDAAMLTPADGADKDTQ